MEYLITVWELNSFSLFTTEAQRTQMDTEKTQKSFMVQKRDIQHAIMTLSDIKETTSVNLRVLRASVVIFLKHERIVTKYLIFSC